MKLTSEQEKVCEALANKECFGVKDHHMKFKDGYKAALQPEQIKLMTPEQLMESGWVTDLINALEFYGDESNKITHHSQGFMPEYFEKVNGIVQYYGKLRDDLLIIFGLKENPESGEPKQKTLEQIELARIFDAFMGKS